MFTLKRIIFLIVIFILFNLDRFYMLPIYLPLDTKPRGAWSASYLGKSIARDAGCTIDFMGDGAFWEEDTTIFTFYCTMPNNSIDFRINVFLNKKLRDTFLAKKETGSYYYSYCFKKGPYYVVCLDPGVPLRGEPFYQQFPGEDISITIGN